MMILRLFICPGCGRIHPGVRKKEMVCSSCETVRMEPIRLPYQKYVAMTQKERADYVVGWMYIRKKTMSIQKKF